MSDIYNEVLKEIEKRQWYCEFGKYTYEPVGDMIKNTVYLTDGRVIDFYLLNAIVEIAKENYGEKVENCNYQSDASDLRKHCLKIRYDLNILNKKLSKWNDETIF